jgi:hypothetical protein
VPEHADKSPHGDWGAIFSRLGISSDFAQKVRFRGPVGKIALVGVICLLGLGGIGIRSSNVTVELGCAALVTLVALCIVGGILWYSHIHPEQATLEGMEVIVLHQQKAWAAKGRIGPPPSGPIIPDPSPPPVEPPEGLDR